MGKLAKVLKGRILQVFDEEPELTEEERNQGVTVEEVDEHAQPGQQHVEEEGDAAS